MNQRPITFGDTPRRSGKRPNDLSDQAAMTIKMGNALMKVRTSVEKGESVTLSSEESRLILIIVRQSIDQAKASKKAADQANERARRDRRK